MLHALWLACLLAAASARADAPEAAGIPPGCDETQPCLLEGLDLDEQQERQIRDLMEAARKKQDALRDDTYQRIRDLLTPAQGRQLDDTRTGILEQRARDLRRQADHLQRRARRLRGGQ